LEAEKEGDRPGSTAATGLGLEAGVFNGSRVLISRSRSLSVVSHQRVVQYAAAVRVHGNVPGRTALRGDNYSLEMPQGISVFEEGDAPRLPLIGLRTIVANKLRLLIDGNRRQVTLKTKGWLRQRGDGRFSPRFSPECGYNVAGRVTVT